MVNRDVKFREGWGHDPVTGKTRTRFAASVGGVELTVWLLTDEWDTVEEIAAKENAALDELEDKIKIESARQSEGALGFGFVGG